MTGNPLREKSISLNSPAKINLFLRILRKREDGYHEIETLLQMVGLCDRLTFRAVPESDIRIRAEGRSIPLGPGNLIHRAARLLRERTGVVRGVEVSVEKNIPVAAGLGGGSGNAAAALLALNRLWGLGLAREELGRLGALLGADVPFFLGGPTAVGRGIGDVLEPLPPPDPVSVLLVNPGMEVSTRWAYESVRIGLTREKTAFKIAPSGFGFLQEGRFDFEAVNDLESAVMERYPVLLEIKTRLLAAGALFALMSGSGPTVFGVFPDAEKAEEADRSIRHENWTNFLVRTIGRLTDLNPEESV